MRGRLTVDGSVHATLPHKPSRATLEPRSLIRAGKIIIYANSIITNYIFCHAVNYYLFVCLFVFSEDTASIQTPKMTPAQSLEQVKREVACPTRKATCFTKTREVTCAEALSTGPPRYARHRWAKWTRCSWTALMTSKLVMASERGRPLCLTRVKAPGKLRPTC